MQKPATPAASRLMARQIAAMNAVFRSQLDLLKDLSSGAVLPLPAAVPLNPSLVVPPVVASALTAQSGTITPPPASSIPSESVLFTGASPVVRGQREMLFLMASEPEASRAYTEQAALALTGQLDRAALRHAWEMLGRRHDSLRILRLNDGGAEIGATLPEWREESLADHQDAVEAALGQELATGFDPEHGPLARAVLFRCREDHHILAMTAHHLIADGWSLGLMMSELAELYNARIAGRAAHLDPSRSFRDFAAWSAALSSDNTPAPAIPALLLPGEGPAQGFAGFRLHRRNPTVPSVTGLPDALYPRIRVAAGRNGASPVMVLLAGFVAFLARLSGQTHFCVGLPFGGHGEAEMPIMVGMASSVLPVEMWIDGQQTFLEVVDMVRRQITAAQTTARRLFAPDPPALPPVSVLFNIDRSVQLSFGGLALESLPLPLTHVKTALFLNVLDLNGDALFDFDCNRSLVSPGTAGLWLDGFLHLMGVAAASPTTRVAALSMGPLAATLADARQSLRDDLGGIAALGTIARLWTQDSTGHWHDSGQLARLDTDGTLITVGSARRHPRLAGGRVDLDAIEAALRQHPAVAEAAVLVEAGHLTAFIVAATRLPPSPAVLDRHARTTLPEAAWPRAYVVLSELPRRNDSRVDESALASCPEERLAARRSVPPRTALEQDLAKLWGEVLGIAPPGVTDSFFDLGGHSLKAVMLLNRIERDYTKTVPVARFLRDPTIANLAVLLSEATTAQPIPPLPRTSDGYAPSDAQSRLWVLDRLEPGQAAYNMGFILRAPGRIDAEQMREALAALARRHDSLRSAVIERDGQPVMMVTEAVPALTCLDIPDADAARHRAELIVTHSFDLSHAPLWRASLLRLPDEDRLVIGLHHIIGDNWSIGVMVRDLLALYGATAVRLPDLPIQYQDYAAWQNAHLVQDNRALDYWRPHLADAPLPLRLPSNRPRSITGGYGAYRRRIVPTALSETLRLLAAEQGATLFMVLNAAFRVWLYQVTASRDVVIGTLHAGRDHPALTDQVGFFVNTLPLRQQLDPAAAFLDLLQQVRQTVLDAFDHAQMPFNRLVEALAPPRLPGGNPLFDIALVMDDWQDVGALLGQSGLQLEEVELPVTQFDYTLIGVEHPDRLELVVQYRADMWDAERIDLWLDQFLDLLEQLGTAPDMALEKVLAPDHLRDQPASVLERFERWRAQTPDAPAVMGQSTLSYAALGDAADRIARRLLPVGVQPNQLVGLWQRRTPELIAAVLGVMKAGAGVLMLDADYPADRLRSMLADSGCSVVLADEELLDAAPTLLPPTITLVRSSDRTSPLALPFPSVAPTDLAYVVYTSGSTGQPKGVLLEQAGLADHLAAVVPAYDLVPGDRSLLFASTGVDTAYEQILLPLTNGATLVIADEERYDPAALLALVRRAGVTILDLPPVFWGEIISLGRQNPDLVAGLSLKTLIVGGEEMTPARVAGWYDLPLFCGRLVNAYGPTETTITPTLALVPPQAGHWPSIPIGRPVGQRQAMLRDEQGQAVPPGEAGELCFSGIGLARGYLNRPEMTAERFTVDRVTGQRIYKTGDLARQRPDGQFEFLGRVDRQIKLRGYRIEPGEIEERLRQDPTLRDAAVTVERDGGEDQLIAWIVPYSAETRLDRGRLSEPLAATLPAYMIPTQFRQIERLPVAPSGKLDRDALRNLPSTLIEGSARTTSRTATPTEDQLCRLWADVLGLAAVDPDDNFFAIGGHSLKAVQVVARIRDHFVCDLSLREFFASPTIAALARLLDQRRDQGGQTAIPLLPRDGDVFPPSYGQRRLWVLQSQQPDLVAFNMVAGFRIEGALDVAALTRAFDALILRHEILRTRLVVRAAEPRQWILPGPDDFTLTVEPVGSAAAAVVDVIHQELTTPFDLAESLPLRARLLRGFDCHALVINVHHIAFDGWSATVMLRDLAALYRAALVETGLADTLAGRANLPPLALQYADYAAWQTAHAAAADRTYWLSRFEDQTIPLLRLPLDHPRPAHVSGRGDMIILPFAAGSSLALKELASRESVSLFAVISALTFLHLHALTRATDLIVGTVVAGRDRQELEDQIGFYLNMLPLREKLDPQHSIRTLVQRCAQTATDAVTHQEYPFDRLIEELDPPREAGRQPLFDVVLILQNLEPMRLELAGTTTTLVQDRSVSAKYDLMYMIEDEGDLRLHLEYAQDLFDHATVTRFAESFVALAEAVAEDPDLTLAAVAARIVPPVAAPAPAAAPVAAATELDDDEW